MAITNIGHISKAILDLAKEVVAEVTLTGNTWRGSPARNQAMLTGRFVGFYAQESFGGNGTEGWQLGSGRLKGTREQAIHFVKTGELPVDGVAAPRKALPAAKKEEPTATQTQPTALVKPAIDPTPIITAMIAAGKSQEEILAIIAALKA